MIDVNLKMLKQFINNSGEDSLTASVFSYLLHLPSETFWQILQQACCAKSLPGYPGEPKLIPWPTWNPAETGNSNCVIPDLFIRFEGFDLIIEAKRRDYPMQDSKQWERELRAYDNEYGKENKQVRILALGGIHSENDKILPHQPFPCVVHMCHWKTVLHECQRLKGELVEENKKKPSTRTLGDVRIFDDLIALFALHDYPALQWFSDFDFKSNPLETDRVGSFQQYLQKISQQFQSCYEFNQ